MVQLTDEEAYQVSRGLCFYINDARERLLKLELRFGQQPDFRETIDAIDAVYIKHFYGSNSN